MLEHLEVIGRDGFSVVPRSGVAHHCARRRLGVEAERGRQRAHELAQRRPHLRGGRRRAGDEEQRPGLVRSEAAQVRAGAADQLPPPVTPGLGVDRDPGHGQALEVPAGRAFADLELPGQLRPR